jgi:hypothetical protein
MNELNINIYNKQKKWEKNIVNMPSFMNYYVENNIQIKPKNYYILLKLNIKYQLELVLHMVM